MRGSIRGLLASVILAGLIVCASAATPEDDYVAVRDVAIARIKAAVAADKHGPMDSTAQAIIDDDNRARAELEKKVRAIVGPVSIRGMAGEAHLNLDTLNDSFQGFGMLDGVVFSGVDARTRVIVTTDGLFKRWLINWWDDKDKPAPQLDGLVRNDNFYTHAILTDAAVVRFADVPLKKPAGASFAYAMLAARTQDMVPDKANEIFVVMAQGGRIYLAYTREFGAVGPAAACEAIRKDYIKRSEAAANEEGLDDAARAKKSEELSGKSDSEFLRCFAEKAAQQKGYAGAARAAQALLNRLPQR